MSGFCESCLNTGISRNNSNNFHHIEMRKVQLLAIITSVTMVVVLLFTVIIIMKYLGEYFANYIDYNDGEDEDDDYNNNEYNNDIQIDLNTNADIYYY